MILLKEIARPPEEKLRYIMGRLIELKQRVDGLTNPMFSYKLLELSTWIVDLENFLLIYKDDQDMFDHANNRAATSPHYPAGYDLKVDLTEVVVVIRAIKTALTALDFTATAELINNVQVWKSMDSSTIITAAADLNNVLTNS